MILDFIREFGSASRQDVDGLLKGKLSDILTPAQQETRIKNLLGIMARRDRSIVNTGSKKGSRWVIPDKDTKPEKYPKKP
jgi:ATP-dependent DNA helicase RecG